MKRSDLSDETLRGEQSSNSTDDTLMDLAESSQYFVDLHVHVLANIDDGPQTEYDLS